MLSSSSQNHVTLSRVKGQGKSSDFIVTVAPSLEHVSFQFSAASHDSKMELFGPNNVQLAHAPNAEITDFAYARFIIVKQPMPGSYRVRIESAGQYWLAAMGKSDIFLTPVEFVERDFEGQFSPRADLFAWSELDSIRTG